MLCQEATISGQDVARFNIGLQGVLNTLSIGVILLSHNSEVLLANSAAESIVADKDWLRVVDRKLRCRPEESAELEARIRLASENKAEEAECILHLSGPSGQNDSLLLAFASLSTVEVLEDEPNCVMCIVVDPDRNRATDAELLKQLYPLTDAEAKIAAFLANGLDYAEIAAHRNVTVSTVRSYSKSIFKKLCVNSRAGVVRKVLAATIPLSLHA
jgi:DNA-binding CsgD family transcriptional regulator